MPVDVTFNGATIGVVILALVQLAGLIGAYYGLKADNAALASNVALSMLTERTDRRAENVTLKSDLTHLINTVENGVKELTQRVVSLETGQGEWTKALRSRTHDLTNLVNELTLKVDRLERNDDRKGANV